MRMLLLSVLLLALVIAPGAAQAPPPAECVDINAAPLAELRRIVHVDTVRAAEIIRLREERRFVSVDQLVRVRGIAAARLADIKAQGIACVKPATAPPGMTLTRTGRTASRARSRRLPLDNAA